MHIHMHKHTQREKSALADERNFALSNEHIDDINWYKNKTSQATINTKLTSLS